MAAEEFGRGQQLLDEAAPWGNSILLREYLDHLRKLQRDRNISLQNEGFGEWLEWAQRVADEFAPSDKRIPPDI